MIVVSKGLSAITTEKKYYRLVQLLSHSFHDVFPFEIIQSMLNMKQYFWFQDNQPVAVVSFRKKGILICNKRYYSNVLYNVATAPLYRKKGYMKKLLQYIIRISKQQKKRCLHLEVSKDNHSAIHLYQKLGFEIMEECNKIYHMRLLLKKKNNPSDKHVQQ